MKPSELFNRAFGGETPAICAELLCCYADAVSQPAAMHQWLLQVTGTSPDPSMPFVPLPPTVEATLAFFQRSLEDAHLRGMDDVPCKVTVHVNVQLSEAELQSIHRLLTIEPPSTGECMLLWGRRFQLPDGGAGALVVYSASGRTWLEAFVLPGDPSAVKVASPPLPDSALWTELLGQSLMVGIGDVVYQIALSSTEHGHG